MTRWNQQITTDDHCLGSSDAVLNIVQYGDYECPYSAQACQQLSRLLEEFKQDVRFVFRHYPQKAIHPNAEMAAIASEAAALQGVFWPMHHTLLDNHSNLSVDEILFYAAQLGLNVEKFVCDMENPGLNQRVQRDIANGVNSHVLSTPTIFFNGARFEKTPNYQNYKLAILEKLLGSSDSYNISHYNL
jgi:protein-disulfide isomerase